MQRAIASELREPMESANTYMKAGIGFVCIPYSTEEERFELIHQAYSVLKKMENSIDEKGEE